MFARIDFNTLGFAEPLYLWLLVVPGCLLVLWMWRFVRRRAEGRRYVRESLVPVPERFGLTGDLAFWMCALVAAAFCIVALARPEARIRVTRNAGADIVLLQDASASMYVTDVAPDRWRRSIQFVRAFADALSWNGDRVALALFAHRATPQMRLTRDPNALFFLIDFLGERSPFRLEDDTTWDTNIQEGVYWGIRLIDKDEELYGKSANTKGFVVISDGQAWSGDVAVALQMAREREIPVYVVGVGTTAGAFIPEPPPPDQPPQRGQPPRPPTRRVRAVLDRNSLSQIALAGRAEYFELGREPDREIAARIIAGIKRRSSNSERVESVEPLYWRFLGYAGLFLCLGAVLLNSKAELGWQAAVALATVLILTTVVAL